MSYIYETLHTNEIARRLYTDRENNGFSYEGCRALAEYLEQYAEDNGEPMELDIVALRCEWAESDLEEFQAYFSADEYPDLGAIRDVTTVIEIEGTDRFIYAEF